MKAFVYELCCQRGAETWEDAEQLCHLSFRIPPSGHVLGKMAQMYLRRFHMMTQKKA